MSSFRCPVYGIQAASGEKAGAAVTVGTPGNVPHTSHICHAQDMLHELHKVQTTNMSAFHSPEFNALGFAKIKYLYDTLTLGYDVMVMVGRTVGTGLVARWGLQRAGHGGWPSCRVMSGCGPERIEPSASGGSGSQDHSAGSASGICGAVWVLPGPDACVHTRHARRGTIEHVIRCEGWCARCP